MQNVLLASLKEVIIFINFITISANQVIIMPITYGFPFIPSVVLKEDPTFVVYEQMDV